MDIISYHKLATCFIEFVVKNNSHLIVLNDIFNNIWRMLHYVKISDLQISAVSLFHFDMQLNALEMLP